MKDIFTVASYIAGRYEREFGQPIDEMKLHKLLYFTQREALIQTDSPIFPQEFQGWRLGPVAPGIRKPYQEGSFDKTVSDADMEGFLPILDYVFKNYAPKDSWSLSRLSHGEACWKNSRKGIAPSESSSQVIPIEDIRLDANRMRERRALLAQRDRL